MKSSWYVNMNIMSKNLIHLQEVHFEYTWIVSHRPYFNINIYTCFQLLYIHARAHNLPTRTSWNAFKHIKHEAHRIIHMSFRENLGFNWKTIPTTSKHCTLIDIHGISYRDQTVRVRVTTSKVWKFLFGWKSLKRKYSWVHA